MNNTHIQWTDSTVNFWMGCRKVSEGCKFCYMYRQQEKFRKSGFIITRTSDKTFKAALKWKEPRKIFTCSMSDFFLEEADDWREEAWDVIRKTPQHQWQILTKRPERILECLPNDWGEGWDNVWLGTSIESQDYLDRATILSEIPAKVRFISAEPLIDEIDFTTIRDVMEKFHWCIIGGESGNEYGKHRYRPCELDWITKIINDLERTPVKVFVKQTGTWLANELQLNDSEGGVIMELPLEIQVREYPVLN